MNGRGHELGAIRSMGGVRVRLTEERWRHVVARHPELESLRRNVLETVAEPDMIHDGDDGERLAVRLYPATPLTRKYVVVAYREVDAHDGFIVTAYVARRPSARRTVLWRR